MKITVDTQTDSPEHIQHMIDFLQRFVTTANRPSTTNEAVPDPEPSMFGMFGDSASEQEERKDDDEPDELPKIEIF